MITVLGQYAIIGGYFLHRIHSDLDCAGRPCVLHHPSEHHMRAWPAHWRGDRRLVERICGHGVGHPDPDERWRVADDAGQMVHGCDGCCRPPDEPGQTITLLGQSPNQPRSPQPPPKE